MNTEVVFIIIVVFLVADFIVERILEWVNMRAMAPVLPENLKGIYDEKEYARVYAYAGNILQYPSMPGGRYNGNHSGAF